MKIYELKKYLSNLSSNELISIIVDLFKSNSFNKEILENKMNPENEIKIHTKYRDIIKNEFFPNFGEPKLTYFILRKAINDFKKISNNHELIADLMIYYVENGVDFTSTYGDIDETFYIKMENMYSSALEYIFKNNLDEKFHDRCVKILKGSDCAGWGFHKALGEIFFAYYDE